MFEAELRDEQGSNLDFLIKFTSQTGEVRPIQHHHSDIFDQDLPPYNEDFLQHLQPPEEQLEQEDQEEIEFVKLREACELQEEKLAEIQSRRIYNQQENIEMPIRKRSDCTIGGSPVKKHKFIRKNRE